MNGNGFVVMYCEHFFFSISVFVCFCFEQELVRALRVEVWPGYITSIRQHEQDMLMCAEISHKIMRSETVYDIIVRVRNESRDDFRKALEKTLLGTTVLTDYNNKV